MKNVRAWLRTCKNSAPWHASIKTNNYILKVETAITYQHATEQGHTHTQELVDISSPEQNEQRPTAKNRSDIWEFSTKNLQGDKCTCNFCGASYSCGKSKGPKQGEFSESIIKFIS